MVIKSLIQADIAQTIEKEKRHLPLPDKEDYNRMLIFFGHMWIRIRVDNIWYDLSINYNGYFVDSPEKTRYKDSIRIKKNVQESDNKKLLEEYIEKEKIRKNRASWMARFSGGTPYTLITRNCWTTAIWDYFK